LAVNLPRFITGVMTRSYAIYISSSCPASNRIAVVLRSWGQTEVHKVGNGRLTSSPVGVSNRTLFLSVGTTPGDKEALQILPLRPRPGTAEVS
jgi:hypothetical protein